jgi:hypothetical protein
VISFVGRPLRKFYDLRGEVFRRLTEFANVGARLREIPDDTGAVSGAFEDLGLPADELPTLKNAQGVLRDLASQLTAFDYNETCCTVRREKAVLRSAECRVRRRHIHFYFLAKLRKLKFKRRAAPLISSIRTLPSELP